MSQWFYAKNNQQHGPVSEEQLKQLAASRQLNPSDLVWTDGMSEWTEARKLKGLFPTQAPPSPPSPPSPGSPRITFVCDGCHATLNIGNEWAGRLVTAPIVVRRPDFLAIPFPFCGIRSGLVCGVCRSRASLGQSC